MNHQEQLSYVKADSIDAPVSKLKEFTKHYKKILIILAILLSLALGRESNDIINIDYGKASVSGAVPLTYSDISTATNEKGEIVILKKSSSAGYKVLFVLSDTVAKGISNINLTQRYQGKL